MELKILVMGEEQDYYAAEINRTRIQKEISKIVGMLNGEELLRRLKTNTGIAANQLRNYGIAIPLRGMTVASETVIDGLERFFADARKYAEKHNAPYVLIQDLKLKGIHQTFDIHGLAQLLIE